MSKRKRILADLDRDIREHIARETQDNIDRGMPPTEARFAALRKFGNVTRAKENTREVWIAVWLEQLLQDVRFGLRMLRKSPGFTAIAVLTLALGLGANTAIFSVVDTILIRPLPYREANRIVFFFERQPRNFMGPADSVLPLVDHQRRYPEVLSQVASFGPGEATLTGVRQPEQISTVEVSSEFFGIVGWYPSIGRSFSVEDEKTGAPPVVVLTDALWKREFGADPGVIGRQVKIDNVARAVIGVMPRNFENPLYQQTDAWLPRSLGAHQHQWIAQIAPNANLRTVGARLAAAEQIIEGHGSDWEVVLNDLREVMVGDMRTQLYLLLGCAVFVLLIACTNVANLLLARGTARRIEITVRAAAGATRGRIARQILTESILLGCIGGAAGLVVAFWTLKLLIAMAPAGIPRLESVRLDGRVLWFAGGISIFTALFFGAIPAIPLMRMDPASSLKEGTATGSGAGARHSRALKSLVSTEVAMALILMLGASLMVRSFLRVRPNHPGFDPVNKLSFMLRPAEWKYSTPAQRFQLMDHVLHRIAAMPGVTEVAATDYLPMSGMMSIGPVVTRPGTKGVIANGRAITPNYFDAMAIPLLSGRAFTNSDNATAPKVAIVSLGMAEKFWPGENVLGKRFTAQFKTGDVEIVGVAADTRETGTNPKRWAEFYFPLAQGRAFLATVIVSSSTPPRAMSSAIQNAVLEVDKDQPITEFNTLAEIVSRNVAVPLFNAYLVCAFAGIALLLAAVGIFGVISYSVKQRTREIGIRIALGASARQVTRDALRAMMLPVASGLAAGWAAAFWLSRFLEGMLYGLSATDATANIAGVAVLCVVAALASYIPARRAAQVDPVIALRSE